MSTPNEDATKQAGAANGTKTTTPQGQEAVDRRVETHGVNTDITGTQVDPKSNADLTNEDGTILYPHPEKSHFSGPAPAEIDPAAGSSPHSPNRGEKETH